MIRSMTAGFLGRLIWQKRSGRGYWPEASGPGGMISSEMPGSRDSLCATTPSPSSVCRYRPSSPISQVFPANRGKKPASLPGFP